MSEDAELVSRIRSGDLDAFQTLYRKYRTALYRTGLAITGDRGAAEEVLQDCFVRAYAAMGRVDTSTSLSAWLHRIVINLSCNWKQHNRQWPLALEEWVERLLPASVDGPEHQAEGNEARELVRQAIGSLSLKQRTVIVLFYLQGFKLSEIAYILDCPIGTVKSRLHYACGALRKRLHKDRRVAGEVAYGTY